MESGRELLIAILNFKPDAVRFKVLLDDIKEPSQVKWESTLGPSASKDFSRTEQVEEDTRAWPESLQNQRCKEHTMLGV